MRARSSSVPVALAAALLAWACGDAASRGSGPDAEGGSGIRDAARPVIDAIVPADLGPQDAAGPRCRLNSDCAPGFYCKDDHCAFDCRVDRDCRPGEHCESGQCLAPACRTDADCGAPARVCTDGACVPGCGTTGCGAGERCDATGRCVVAPCGGCPAGQTCDMGSGQCVPDPCGGCPAGQRCNPDTGLCVRTADCGGCPAGQRCDVNAGQCVPEDCGGCPQGQRCDANRARCVPEDCGGCPRGQRCDPIAVQCVAEDCGGCPADQRCDPDTARCVAVDCGGCPEAQHCDPVTEVCVPDDPGALGAPCRTDDECDTGICLGVSFPGHHESFCSALCCTEDQCPEGFGCLYLNGVRYCLPGRVNPQGDGFTRIADQSCGDGNECRSGLCELRQNGSDRCLQACCTDADCGGIACTFGPPAAPSRTYCDLQATLLYDPAGYACGDLGINNCQSGICLPSGMEEPPGFCAALCCTSAECGGDLVCGQVFASDPHDVTSACAPLPRGADADGMPCVDGNTCHSGLCAGGTCAEPCCFDVDCFPLLPGSRCLPVDNGQGGRVRACLVAQ